MFWATWTETPEKVQFIFCLLARKNIGRSLLHLTAKTELDATPVDLAPGSTVNA